MRFALQTDFALRTLIYLAMQDERATIGDVAAFYGISAAHVAKVVNQLSRLGYVRSIRGIGGGVELARDPRDISVGEVVLAFEGNLHLLECIGVEDVCVIQPFCKLKGVLAEAERIQTDYLRGVTLQDVLPTRRQTRRVEAARQGG
ncbi:MAG: Rrf2 family transcriptional regulator [Planctomycetes bacterium]|nr:Rrf2 family transcriptional regulator [Planctomycetota bacterium]